MINLQGPLQEIQMLASCVYSTRVAAVHELTTAKVIDPERMKALQELVTFADEFLKGVQTAKALADVPGLFTQDQLKKLKP